MPAIIFLHDFNKILINVAKIICYAFFLSIGKTSLTFNKNINVRWKYDYILSIKWEFYVLQVELVLATAFISMRSQLTYERPTVCPAHKTNCRKNC